MRFKLKENIYGHKKRCRFIISIIEKETRIKGKKSLRILDVGCGTGYRITLPIAEAGYKVTGLDVDKNSIELANRLNVFERANFIHGQLQDLVGSYKKYDIVICSEVLEHLSNPSRMLSLIRKVLKPKGVIIITIPNGFGPFEIENFIHRLLRPLKFIIPIKLLSKIVFKNKQEEQIPLTKNVKSPHIQFFTLGRFKCMLYSIELEIERMEKSSFLAGYFTNLIIGKSSKLINWNVNKATKFLPYFLCSGWYFVVKPTKN